MDKNRQAVINETKRLIKLGNSKFPRGYLNPDKVTFRFTLWGKTAGKARYESDSVFTLWFHPEFMERDLDEYIKQTVAHEVAHLFQRKIYPYSKPHGREFKHIAQGLGDDGSRCHSLDASGIGRLKTRYIYSCPHGCYEFKFTKHEHKVQQDFKKTKPFGKHYNCKSCYENLEWTGEVRKFR